MRVIGYCRVSTERQGRSGLGLDAQEDALRSWCELRGLSGSLEVVREVGSGATIDRRALAAIVDSLSEGDVLAAAKWDRLSRSTIHGAELLARAQREGWTLVALDLGVDTSTAIGEALATIMGALAQLERRQIGERTSAALQARKRAGATLGRPRRVSVEVEELVCGRWAEGRPVWAIAAELDASQHRPPESVAWSPSTVRAIIRRSERSPAAA